MRILVNALSTRSFSGRHVVYGFMSQLAQWTVDRHEILVLHNAASAPPAPLAGAPNVRCLEESPKLSHWAHRAVWETYELPRLIRRQSVDLLISPSGGLTPRCPCRQVVLAQNPWCYVRQVHSGRSQQVKALLQRWAYRQAFRRADHMVFISDYLRSLYRSHAGAERTGPAEIAYPGINEDTYHAAERSTAEVERDPRLVLSVSAMAPWKGAETLVSAVHLLHNDGVECRLRLVGPWPDRSYAERIEQQVARLRLKDTVEITGAVSDEALHRHYAEARVFALMSQCESFGIPAAEAQAFGTPAVLSQGCAMPEICGPGGVYGPAGDVEWTAATLRRMLDDNDHWQEHSEAARRNSEKLRWAYCTRPWLSVVAA